MIIEQYRVFSIKAYDAFEQNEWRAPQQVTSYFGTGEYQEFK